MKRFDEFADKARIIKRYKRELENILNLECGVCGIAFSTNYHMVKYCNPCMKELEQYDGTEED